MIKSRALQKMILVLGSPWKVVLKLGASHKMVLKCEVPYKIGMKYRDSSDLSIYKILPKCGASY